MARKWTNVSVPKDMVNRAKILVDEPEIRQKYGFGSVSEFVRRVLSEKIDSLEKEIQKEREKD